MDISINRIKQTKFYKSLMQFANSGPVAKILASMIVWFCALIPTYGYLIIRWGLDPEGFWQELALFLVFCVVVGWLQVLLLFIAILATFNIISTRV